MGKTKFNAKWQTNRPWLKPVKSDIYSAYCDACKCRFSISGSGVSQVTSHESRGKHVETIKAFQSQRVIQKGVGSLLQLSQNK